MHVAIIMDGNGRWAVERGLPRTAGHRAGVQAVRRAITAAAQAGVTTLTLYAFSSDNWRRPPAEVDALMGLLERYLRREVRRCVETGIRLSVLGRRDRLPEPLAPAIAAAERATRGGTRIHVRIAIDYSSRDAILLALRAAGRKATRESLAAHLGPDVDLLIRTGGDQRLSDFLLWECAYAELYFTPRPWPDFDASDLGEALQAYHGRQRRFGGLPAAWASPQGAGASS